MSDPARDWIDSVTARGVTLIARGGRRLEFIPKSSYNGLLTISDKAILREHRDAIITEIESRGGQADALVSSSPVVNWLLAEGQRQPRPFRLHQQPPVRPMQPGSSLSPSRVLRHPRVTSLRTNCWRPPRCSR